MLRCWADSPDARPTFTELCQDLEEWMQQATSYLFMSELSYPFHPDSNIAADLDDKNAGF